MTAIIWLVLPIVCVLAAAIYLYCKVRGGGVCFAADWSAKRLRTVAVVVTLLLILPAVRIYGIWFIILLHLVAFLLITDGVVLIVKKVGEKREKKVWSRVWCRVYRSGIIAVLLTAVVIGYGGYNIFHVVRTEYTVGTEKTIRSEGYRLALLSDLHYGITMDDAQLEKEAERISAENPDIVVLDGDIVDENTTQAQMKSAFRILGSIRSKYGIYYTYGNHDKNNYSSSPNYTAEQLAKTIEASGIHILEDDTTVINDEIALIGRADRGDGDETREKISTLTSGLDEKQEWIVLDHQPSDYENVEHAGCDLILSGHTHAGQIWPAGLLSTAFHLNELTYGKIAQGNLNAVVTSGIAGWGYPVRTEKHSEYVVLDIVPDAGK